MKTLLFALVGAIIIMQFIRPDRNISAAPAGPQDLAVMYPPPAAVQHVLERACYDCHSDNTRYPWYANVQPVGWWLAHHVNEGKRHLNFSTFGSYPAKRQTHRLKDIVEQLKKGEMPLESYTLVHTDARLTAGEIKSLTDWVESIRAKIPQS